MNVEIIVIGDELLIGQVTDTNSGWIARELNHIGWEVTEITTVRDRSREITDALNSSFGRVDVVLMTGGLGPTKDDITKQTLCDYFGGKLVFDESVFANVEAIFRRRKLTMNDSTRNQAYVPNMCTVIQNPVGTAPVMWFERNGKVLVSMPGVPTEMKTVMKEVVISRLREYFQDHSSILHRTCLVKDFTESRLSETLSDFEAQLPACIKLAYLPTPGVIRLRLTARGDETGGYTEVYFPEHNVRYIAVTDGVDTAKGSTMDITPFKNLLNDMYAQDISKKIKSSLLIRQKHVREYPQGRCASRLTTPLRQPCWHNTHYRPDRHNRLQWNPY